MLLGKPLDAIREEDLEQLVENEYREQKVIDYKVSLPGRSEGDKKEFLADVSSFANASGGHLVFGITEENGLPTRIEGLAADKIDGEISRLENLIRDGISPRIPGLLIKVIPVSNSRACLIIHIPRSWALPHMVIYQNHFKFYGRNSNGKYPLDVQELRAVFALSATTADRIRAFRTARLSTVVADEAPVILAPNPKIVFQIVPFSAFAPAAQYDLPTLRAGSDLRPFGRGCDLRFNFDGLLAFAQTREGFAHAYLQVFRNGIIEAVDSLLLSVRADCHPTIPSIAFEDRLLESLKQFLAILKHLVVEPPFAVMLSLINVAGYTMAVENRHYFADEYPIDRDTLIIPEVLIESFQVEPTVLMKPIFDAVWNATGWARSMSYDADGTWHR